MQALKPTDCFTEAAATRPTPLKSLKIRQKSGYWFVLDQSVGMWAETGSDHLFTSCCVHFL